MSQLIRGLGHEVAVADSVASALALTSHSRFDLVLSDIGLPDGTGIDFIYAFRKHSLAPAIALTGFGTDEDVRRCLDAGFTAHLTKPINFEHLERLIEKAAVIRVADRPGS
jgi:CheY-like chemotaxis protein